MSHPSNTRGGSEPQVPTTMLNRHRGDWHSFTHAIVITCVSVAVVLILMLLFLRVL